MTCVHCAAQVDYAVRNGWVPCLEFAEAADAYVGSKSCVRFGPVSSVSDVYT